MVELGWVRLGWIVLPKTRSERQPAASKLASVDDAGVAAVELHWGDIELEPLGVVESYQLCLFVVVQREHVKY